MGVAGPMAADGSLALVEPSAEYAAAFLEMAEEFQQSGETRYERDLPVLRSNFAAYVDSLQRLVRGKNIPAGFVPGDEFWLLGSGSIHGIIRLRHWLTPALEQRGGHIGYAVRPGSRRCGYGKRMLAMLLEHLREPGWQKAKRLDLRRVLITCAAENIPSARIVEANGGRLENKIWVGGELVARYWIEL